MGFDNDAGKSRFACNGEQDPNGAGDSLPDARSSGGPGPGERAVDERQQGGGGRPIEVYPVGMFGKAPELDDPVYYRTRAGVDGNPATVGPFELTGQQIKNWASRQTTNDINDLVERGQLRPQTALTLKSAQFETMVNLLTEGQDLPPNMVQRFIPGDLQRVVYGKLCEGQPRRK